MESIVNQIFEFYKKEEKDTVKKYGEAFRYHDYDSNLEGFIALLKEYFELENIESDSFKFDSSYDYARQKEAKLTYLRVLLNDIKPFLLFAVKLAYNSTISEAFKENRINEGSLVNMLENFFNLNRTGRKRVFYTWEKEKFIEFKKKYKSIIDYYHETESWTNIKNKGSILDYAKAIKKYNLIKENLMLYLLDVNHWIRECSKATKYRFDKDLFIIKDIKYTVKKTSEDYDFLLKCLDDHENYVKEKK